MLISHEVPICLLNESKKFNDYDYCLLHLLFENQKYCDYYMNASKEGRRVLLDNSIFELGEALNNDLIFKGVELVDPEWVVAPDVLDDCLGTVINFKVFKSQFKSKFPNSRTKIIGVIQGKTLGELVSCYRYMSNNADKIAIPFRSKGYEEIADHDYRRHSFIHHLIMYNIWDKNKPHHLLGCYRAKEFSNYDFSNLNIESLDTSNPVIAGINNFKYENEGLAFKPAGKLCDLIDVELDFNQKQLIEYNIKQFRKIADNN